ncbi:MAG TPA: hypothetical protein VLK58_07090 [Conexibacter sp.]|nr:hypothetical protein [Conexibacter sp.]
MLQRQVGERQQPRAVADGGEQPVVDGARPGGGVGCVEALAEERRRDRDGGGVEADPVEVRDELVGRVQPARPDDVAVDVAFKFISGN